MICNFIQQERQIRKHFAGICYFYIQFGNNVVTITPEALQCYCHSPRTLLSPTVRGL